MAETTLPFVSVINCGWSVISLLINCLHKFSEFKLALKN